MNAYTFGAIALTALLWVAPFGVATAQTADGQTPSSESICDGQVGAAFGLCNAYCEAMDCDSLDPQASDTACNKIQNSFENITGSPPPCVQVCPCYVPGSNFAAVIDGDLPVDTCVDGPYGSYSELTYIGFGVCSSPSDCDYYAGQETDYTIVKTYCVYQQLGQSAEVTDFQNDPYKGCRSLLRAAARAADTVCVPPSQ
jgi:hypothetical protein